jgi:PhnB protein
MIGVNPYIAFNGNAQEAIDFYKKALGAELLFSQTWGETPHSQPGMEDKIMHATIKVGDSPIMMCDMPESEAKSESNISLTLGLNDTDAAKKYFDNLSQGGTVTMPLDKTFWAEAFGMVTDKFGINWMVNCDSAKEGADKAAA